MNAVRVFLVVAFALFVVTGNVMANPILSLIGHSDQVSSVAFSSDGKLLASGSWEGTVRLWNVASGDCVAILAGHTDRVNAVAFSTDGCTIASGADDRTVRVWDASSHRCVTILGTRGAVKSIAFSPDGTLLASGEWPIAPRWRDRQLRVWDVTSYQCIATWTTHEPATAMLTVAFSPDGTLLASGASDGKIHLWSVSSLTNEQ